MAIIRSFTPQSTHPEPSAAGNWWHFYLAPVNLAGRRVARFGGKWHQAEAEADTLKGAAFVSWCSLPPELWSWSDDDWKRRQAEIRYRAEFIPVDFDHKTDLGQALTDVQRFRDRLVSLGVDVAGVPLYASGEKGFHAELPAGLVGAIPADGLPLLPKVCEAFLREAGLWFSTTDISVYSLGRGKLWRRPCVERTDKAGKPTGRYKVPVRWDRFDSMSPDELAAEYGGVVAAPAAGSREVRHVC